MSIEFSVEIINLVKKLKKEHETIISNQIGRSGTSIGANIREANYAQSKSDFISKLEIALKEANETGYIDEPCYKKLNNICSGIRVLLIASCKTAKENQSNGIKKS